MKSVAAFSAGAVVAIADPDQPHLAQAWTALSKGDGLPNQVGQESYIWDDARKIRAHWYKYDGCQKLSIHDPSQVHHVTRGERNFYLGCDAVDCCYGDYSMKQWDIGMGTNSKVTFVGYEDTTELKDNPVAQAEHWHEEIPLLFTQYKIQYDHYVSRADTGDIISHRINFNSTAGLFPPGEILYSDFQVQHDLDAFIQNEFQIPQQCLRNNLLNCDGDSVARWETTYFKHEAALKAMQAASESVSKPVDAFDMLLGVVEGMLSDQPDLVNCVLGGVGTALDAKVAFDDIKKAIAGKDIPDVADALDAIAAALRDIPATMEPCGAAKADADIVIASIKEIHSLKDLLTRVDAHLVGDFKNVMTEVKGAKDSWASKDYEACGKHVGMALHRLVIGKFPDGDVVV